MNKNIILYSTGCPKCKVLKKKLESSKIEYEECNDEDIMREIGIEEVPVLMVSGVMMKFSEVIKWLNEKVVAHAYTD